MTSDDLRSWEQKSGATSPERLYCNGIDYLVYTLPDTWRAIFEYNKYSGEYIPLIQAKDDQHVKSYINLREPITVPFERIC